MSLVNELRDLMQSEHAVSGRVIAMFGDRVRIATASGQVEVGHEGELKIGDQVTVQNNRAIKQQRSTGKIFFV